MTLKQLEKTVWAKRFKKDCESSYRYAIKYALNPKTEYFIYKNNEAGIWQWSIACENNFWMDSFKTKKEAAALCKKMEWKLK